MLLIAIVLALLSSESFKNVFFSTVSIDDASEFNMTIGVARKLTCTTNPNEISDDVTWDSSNPSVAVVRHNGVVVAKSEGTATITVAIDGVVKDSCTVHVSAKPVSVNNGQMIISPKKTGYPEVTINAPKGKNCFVYFDNVYNSSNDFAFYVVAGSSATVNAPSGTYDFYYATGDIWYGKEQKFGKDTNYYRSPDVITLSEDSTSYDSIELTLYTVPNGNMDTDPVDENMFPI